MSISQSWLFFKAFKIFHPRLNLVYWCVIVHQCWLIVVCILHLGTFFSDRVSYKTTCKQPFIHYMAYFLNLFLRSDLMVTTFPRRFATETLQVTHVILFHSLLQQQPKDTKHNLCKIKFISITTYISPHGVLVWW